MPPIYKALIVVFVISVAALVFYRRPFAEITGRKRYDNWAALWLAMTVCAFVIGNFWIFAGVAGALIFFLGRREPLKPAIFALLVCAVPPYSVAIPGFAGINKFIDVNAQLVVIISVLLPAMLFSKQMKKLSRLGNTTDLFVLLWLLLQVGLAVRAPSFTHGLRIGVEEFLAVAPIYYVFSRYPKTFEDFRILSAAIVLPIIVLAAIAIIEFGLGWHFYNHISDAWNIDLRHGYKLREGFLRASTSTHNSIAWGFIAMCGIGVALAVLNDGVSKFYRNAGIVILTIGLVLSLSRGPWIGGAAVAIIFVLTGQKALSRFSQLSVTSLGLFLFSMLTPLGQRIIDLLPFIGESGGDTISYREQLLEASWEVIWENPWLGSDTYLSHPKLEAMRQGEGIIDIVNTYAQVALDSGFVGLFFFVGIFVSTLLLLRQSAKSAKAFSPKLALYCQAYFATMCGVMITIFTTSSIEPIPQLYWLLIGGAVALARAEALARQQASQERAQSTGLDAPSPARPAFDWK